MLSLYIAELRSGEGKEEQTERLLGLLPPGSRDKALSRRGAALLTALGELVRVRMMDAAGVGYEAAYGKNGKPYVPNTDNVTFSISHSGSVAAGALLTGGGEVGVDIERVDRENGVRHERIAARFYTDAERAFIDASDDRESAFYTVWTRKEAYLKYTGDGMTRPLTEVDTVRLPDGVSVVNRVIEAADGEYALSVVTPAGYMPDIENILINKIYF